MCFSKPKQPDYAEEDRKAEEERLGQVRAGTDAVNQAFSRFTPSYYGGIGEAFRNYYAPQFADQAKQAQRAVSLSFANNPNSSAANRVASNLERDRVTRQGELENAAQDAMNSARREVEDRRGNLLNVVEAGSTVENAASQAINQANQQIGRPQFSPIGDLFSKYTSMLGTTAARRDAGLPTQPFFQRQVDFLRGGGSGSSTVVGS